MVKVKVEIDFETPQAFKFFEDEAKGTNSTLGEVIGAYLESDYRTAKMIMEAAERSPAVRKMLERMDD